MTSTGDAALSISNVSKSYNTTEALRALDLEVGPGRIFGLLGPNGAGKSTLINILVGLLKRDSGTIRVFGETIEYGSYEYKRRVGFVLERPTYVEKLTAREYLELAGSMYDLSDADIDERVSELVAFFDLREKADDWIETYSRGMRSKVSLAAALIHDPDLLILDEPFEGIDAPAQRSIKVTFRRIADRGGTIVIASHVLDTVERLCDEIAILQAGQVISIGKTSTLLHDEDGSRQYETLEDFFVDRTGGEAESRMLSWS